MQNLESVLPKVSDSALKQIREMSDRLDSHYQTMKAERQALAEWEETQEFSILGLLELYSGDVQGYAEQALTNYPLDNLQSVIEHLKRSNLLENPDFATWYFSDTAFPIVRQYAELIDHLRLLLLEYFSQPLQTATEKF
ncbi:hypothetical protein ACKFKF_10590 [Phormidesmis sp. 146-12]